jgi:hypothetical protein
MGEASLIDLVRIVKNRRQGRKGARGAAGEARSEYGHSNLVMSRAEVDSSEDLVGNGSVNSTEAEWAWAVDTAPSRERGGTPEVEWA